jgi:hypothetical protein
MGADSIRSGCGWALFERGLSADWVAFGPFEAPFRHESGIHGKRPLPVSIGWRDCGLFDFSTTSILPDGA